MLVHLAGPVLAALTWAVFLGAAQAAGPFVPTWIGNDPANKTVTMEIVADWNQVARYAKGDVRTDIIDFNGYYSGNITLIVPTGWSVRIAFINGSANFRHSLMVTRVYAKNEMPVKLEPKDAIWGAYTDPPEGIHPKEKAQLDFVSQQAGSYFLACARQTHLMDGHWIGFEVRDGLEQAVAIIHEDRFVPNDLPGRP